jgi:3-oxoacyl-[acyl-carrier protein] reductase
MIQLIVRTKESEMFDLGLKDKVAIITGGSDGLGRAGAERLAAAGAKVAIAARRPDHLARAAEGIQAATGQEVLAVPTDVTKAADCERLVEAVLGRWGRVDILLNNAGTSAAGPMADVDDETWQADWELKVMGAVRMMRLVLPGMQRQRDGRIVNITTVHGKAPRARGLPTSVTRAAGINLTKSVANEYAAFNVRVNTICIGLVRTPQIDRWDQGSDLEGHYAGLGRDRVPLGRVASAGEFADLFAFLVSDRATYITGTAINFDGGSGLTT